MPLLFRDYMDILLKDYKTRRDKRLSVLLKHPTPGNLLKESINLFRERSADEQKKDEAMLRGFFGVPPEGKDYDFLFRNFKAEKFKPLQSFIEGRTKDPSPVLIELFAWLLNFNHRPYEEFQRKWSSQGQPPVVDPGSDASIEPKNTMSTGQSIDEPEAKKVENEISVEKEKAARGRGMTKKITVAAGLLTAAVIGTMYISKHPKSGCMVWETDRYVEVPCNSKQPGKVVLAYEEEKAENFRRIMRLDTITQWSVGKIFYSRSHKTITCYTAPGNLPQDLTRHVRPLSQYMFDKYFAGKLVKGVPQSEIIIKSGE